MAAHQQKASVKVSYTIDAGPTYIAKLGRKAAIEIEDEAGLYASTPLKACLSAILMSRPELLEDAADYSISCLDQQETEATRQRRDDAKLRGLTVSPVKAAGDKIWEGKGMLSWVMQEADAAQDPDLEPATAAGKLTGATLNVTLIFSKRNTISRTSFLDQLRAPSPLAAASPSASPLNTTGDDPFLAPPPPRATAAPSSSSVASSAAATTTVRASSPMAPTPSFNLIQPTPAPSTSFSIHPPVSPTVTSQSPADALPDLTITASCEASTSASAPAARPAQPTPQPLAAEQQAQPPQASVNAVPMSDGFLASSDMSNRKKSKAKATGSTSASGQQQQQQQQQPKKLKFDEQGCINCGVQYAMLWRKRKNGQGGGKLCNTCGIYYNKNNAHRPVTAEQKQAVAKGLSDHAMDDIGPSKPAKQRKTNHQGLAQQTQTSPTQPSAAATRIENSLRRSPRRSADSKKQSTHQVPASSPGPASRRLQQTQQDLPVMPKSPGKARVQDISMPSSSSVFSSLPSKLFDSDFTAAINSDIFSALTSDAPMPDDAAKGIGANDMDLDNLFSDIDMNQLFSDAPMPPANGTDHQQQRQEVPEKKPAPEPTNFLQDLFAGHQLHSDALTEADLPPSSPPNHKKLFPAALNGGASEGGSPNLSEATAETPRDSHQNPAAHPVLASALENAAAQGIHWSEGAISALTNALVGPSGQMDGTLSEQTLQDLFQTICASTSPPNRPGSAKPKDGDSTPTPGVSPSPSGTAANNQSKLDIQPVAEVNAEVALEIWNREVAAAFKSNASKQGTTQ